jgi:hypothetical protein
MCSNIGTPVPVLNNLVSDILCFAVPRINMVLGGITKPMATKQYALFVVNKNEYIKITY